MTTRSTRASMSTSTSQAWLIVALVRLTSRNRAPVRSAPQKTAPWRSPSNSSGTSAPLRRRRTGRRLALDRRRRPAAEQVLPAAVELVEGPAVVLLDRRLDLPARHQLHGAA